MSRPSLGLVPKLVLYLNFLLWQLGSGASVAGQPVQSQSTEEPTLSEDEVSALEAIASNLEVKLEPDTSVKYCTNPTSNFYVVCKNESINSWLYHVTTMRINDQGLTGVIPREVIYLRYLKILDLSNNKLHGTIPSSLGYLFYLEELDLSNNQLTGSIPPSLAYSGSLEYLNLENNFLDGPIPGSLGSLINLTSLSLQFNRLTGPIPDEFGELTNLTYLYLSENQLFGPLPPSLGNLRKLRYFHVSSNYLTGTLPKSYGQLTELLRFSIAGNYICGPIPDFIKKWTKIYYLSFLGNKFEGKLPQEVLNFPYLVHLSISDVANSSFEFPSTINSIGLISLILRNCSIGGTIPKYIAQNMSSLEYLDLSFNYLVGELPDYMGSSLSYMSFAGNKLNGTIPAWIFLAVGTRMDLSFNNFSEVDYHQVPRNLNLFACCRSSFSTAATHMNNDLHQMMNTYCPKEKYHSLFINCGGGETVVDGNNYDQDNDTSHFYTSPKHNWAYSFSGDYGETSNFSEPSVYTQNVTSGISIADASLYDKARLSPLSLKYFAFCLLDGNYTVTLHFAEIAYRDDAHYTSLRKRAFDVYIQRERKLNYFNIKDQAGGPDQPITKNFSAVRVNNSRMEIHLYWPGKGSTYFEDYYGDEPTLNGPLISAISVTPDFKVADGDGNKQHPPLQIGILITIASIVIALPLFLVVAWWMGLLGSTKLRKINIGQDKNATLKELIAATGKFSDKKKIGSGGFGIVYEAKLQGQTVAVKRLSTHFRERIKELKTEISTITVLKHNNLIKLLDVHIEKDLQFLVYEYMENRSLADALFDPSSKLKLTWEIRYNICLGIARGLEYLHEHPRLKIVHMNIKAANILLDGNLEAKISDFGLASIYPEEDQVMVINKEVSQGYTAPEYFQGNVTSKADVYSFGVVLLEIVSGKKNVSKSNQETELLIDMAHKAQAKGKLKDLVDKNLDACNFKQALTILNLAVKCTNVARSMRPTMSEVVSELLGKNNNEYGEKTKASEEFANVDSTTSAELASIASTSSPFFKGTDNELENISVVLPQKS